ncbi:hypothetical protein [Massilia sp. S19_KUP03_FR1]|uniref:hypothetical protein n=1 Tax=Massilia sp. S19_KUP03_FR1 TaxID=3025503 RepID=UPI002FCD778B
MGDTDRETIMHRHLLRVAILAIATPLLLGACRDNTDPVKPRVSLPAAAQSAA